MFQIGLAAKMRNSSKDTPRLAIPPTGARETWAGALVILRVFVAIIPRLATLVEPPRPVSSVSPLLLLSQPREVFAGFREIRLKT